MNLRACDLCKTVLPMATQWYFITEGRAQPSDWMLAQHWCSACISSIHEVFQDQSSCETAGRTRTDE